MKLSKRGEYALRALIGLAVSERQGHRTVALTQLAERENIPAPFLEQILRQLKEGGYIASTRGKEGGYSLALPSARVSVGEVVRFVEGPLAPVRCVSRTAYERCSCPNEHACGLRLLMEQVRNSVADILDGTTLAALAEGVSCAASVSVDRVEVPPTGAPGFEWEGAPAVRPLAPGEARPSGVPGERDTGTRVVGAKG